MHVQHTFFCIQVKCEHLPYVLSLSSLSSVLFSSLLPFSLHCELWLLPMSLSLDVAASDLDDIDDVISHQVGGDWSCDFNYCNLFLWWFPNDAVGIVDLAYLHQQQRFCSNWSFILNTTRCNRGVDDIISDCDVNKWYVRASLGLGVADFVMAAVEGDVF